MADDSEICSTAVLAEHAGHSLKLLTLTINIFWEAMPSSHVLFLIFFPRQFEFMHTYVGFTHSCMHSQKAARHSSQMAQTALIPRMPLLWVHMGLIDGLID